MSKIDLSPTNRLFAAVADGSLSGVAEACEAGANVNAVNSKNETPLFLACENGFAHIVEQLLEQPDIDITKGGYDYHRQAPAGCVAPPRGKPQYHTTPLCAAVEGGYGRIVKMLLDHEDGDKYLQPNDEWETTIARAFEHWYISSELGSLIKAAMMADRKFLLFTIQKIIEYGVDYFYGNAKELAALLKRFPSEVQTLALGCFASSLIRIVKLNDKYGELEYFLQVAPYFCEKDRLRPYLLSAIHLARQLHYDECESTLCDALEGRIVVH